jgi:zinc/manganese transport system permease protein
LVTPAAAALRLSSSQLLVPLISVGIALASVLGGIMLALGSGLPISPYITTISFLFYLLARLIQYAKARSARGQATQSAQKSVPASPAHALYVRGDRHVDGN